MFILLSGDDEFSAHEELARIRASADFGYNQDFFAGETADLAVIRNTCDTMPFLAEKRLVVLESLPKPPKSKGDDDQGGSEEGGSEESVETPEPPIAPAPKGRRGKKGATTGLSPRAFAQGIADFVPSLPETTLLVALITEKLKPDHPLMQAARSHGKSQIFTKPHGAQLQDWVLRRARSQKRLMAPEAAHMLVELLGDNLRMLASEIDKLGVYVGESGEIGPDDVRTLTSAGRELDAFELTDALARGNRSAALARLHGLLDQGEAPLRIVGLVAFQTRALMQVKRLSERGMSTFQIAETAGLKPYVVEKSLPLARQFTFPQLEAAHHALLEIDTALKRSRMTPELALDLLVLEFGAVR